MSFTNQDVVKLRETTGAGMMACKKALAHTDGDMTKAIDYLREQGISVAAKKSSRIASEGIVDAYIHFNGKIGVMLEVNCESDFVAQNPEFKALCHDIGMHIAAMNPSYISRDEIPQEIIEREKSVLRAQAKNEGKPDGVIEKMVEGRVKKFYADFVLLDQEFCKDSSVTIEALVNNATAKIGEKISIRRFVRYVMGEGLEKKEDNLADEVAKLQNK